MKYINNENEVYEDNYILEVARHSASHLLAAAIKNLYKDAKLWVGPATETGFYYDFDNLKIEMEDLEKIEKEMKRLVKENLKFETFKMNKSEAKELLKDEPYKLYLLEDKEEATFFKMGEFTDMCKGPHVLYLKSIGHFKLLSITGAYFKGDSKEKMLTRIYGTCFEKKEELENYVKALEEAKSFDHNKIGRDLQLFTTSEPIGQGLPLLMPKGTKVMQILQRFVEDEEERRGYLLTKTPLLAKKELYQISGHWDHYKDGMFIIGDEEKDKEIFALRPMTCPFQFMIYNNDMHSYKELPIRYNETSTLFRNESSGEMHGLIRVRQFTLAEGHIICTKDQIEKEFMDALNLIIYMMKVLGIYDKITYRFSKWDENDKEKYIDNKQGWEETQVIMKNILNHLKLEYKEADGEAAFYGPKLDIQYKNVYGKEDTIMTIQIDFALPGRFNMTYINKEGNKETPYIIHRSSMGCYERTLAMIIEHTKGFLPLWLAPVQVKILTLSENEIEYANEIKAKLNNYRVEIDDSDKKLGFKIRESSMQKLPYTIILGKNELENKTITVRTKDEELKDIKVEDFILKLDNEIKDTFNK